MPGIEIDTEFRLGLHQVLASLKDRESFGIVQADLGDPDPEIRAGAIRLIGELEHTELLPNLLERLDKIYGREQPPGELKFTLAVFDALQTVGTGDVAEDMVRKFEQLGDRLKPAALDVIAARGAGSTLVEGFLLGLMRLDSPYPRLRAQAVERYAHVGRAGANPKAVVLEIRKHLKDADHSVCITAAECLAKLLGERVFELPEWRSMSPDIHAHILQIAPAVPSATLDVALKSKSPEVRTTAVFRVLSAAEPPDALREVLRIYSNDILEEIVAADPLAGTLGRWYSAGTSQRLALQQIFSYILRRHATALQKYMSGPSGPLTDIDLFMARIRSTFLRSGSERLADALQHALQGRVHSGALKAAVDEMLRIRPTEKELADVVDDILAVTDDRIRKRIASELRTLPQGAFMPVRKLLKVLPPIRDPELTAAFRTFRDLAKSHGDSELLWMSIMHLAGCGEAAATAAVCDVILEDLAPATTSELPRHLDVSLWIRSIDPATTSTRVRETLITILKRSTRLETFRAAVEQMTMKVDSEVSSILMLRLPSLKGALRFIVVQAIGRMGDRVHLPVFMNELKADSEDRLLGGLLGLEKLLDANSDLPPDTVSTPLYQLRSHPSAMVRTSAIGLLVRLKDSNRWDLVAELLSSASPVPAGAFRLCVELAEDESTTHPQRLRLFQGLVTRIGRMAENKDAVCDAMRAVLDGRPFAELLRPQQQRAEAVQDLKELLRQHSTSTAAADFKISKAIHRLAIVFIDITGFTPRAARMTAIELGVFLVEVEDEILPFIRKHSGKLIKRLGDGFLVSFPAAPPAVTCCLEMLQHLALKNQLLQEEDRIRLRAGIHVGDVLVDREDVFGDTVNIAARIETLARPMCICMSEDVYADLTVKSSLIESMGPSKLKGRDEPLGIHRIRLDAIYETQTDSLQKLISTPDSLPKLDRYEKELEEVYTWIKEKIEEARHAARRGDHAHAEALLEDIEKRML